MILIPFPFLTSAVLLVAWLALRAVARTPTRSLSYIDAFFALVATQSALLGLRHGYGWAPAGLLLPIAAALLPPLALASFERPPWRWQLCWHALPALLIAIAWLSVPALIDILVPLVFVGYAAVLARRGLAHESRLTWARLGDMPGSRLALWMMVAALLFSALADVVIAIDFAQTRGANTGVIMLIAQSIVIIAVCLIIWRGIPAPHLDPPALPVAEPLNEPGGDDELKADFQRIDAELRSRSLHLDADLNLQRLARKVGVPARRVSAAVNAIEGVNVSQWVNRLRIEHAQQLLGNPERLITDIIYSSGFNTKSSFHREFKRATGATPSAWRREHAIAGGDQSAAGQSSVSG